MKLKFKSQSFQTAAVNAVVDIFNGQRKSVDTFTITNEKQLIIDENGMASAIVGTANVLQISDEKITENMNAVQKRFSLPVTNDEPHSFCIEMETGTGKTYVYTKTIYELHKQYGFTKFIIVVPSVAIREGVFKSFQITAEHFALQYDYTPVRCFIYDSKKLSQVRLFATSSDIEIMIINIDAFKKAENIFNQERDSLNGDAAINLIQATRPIVIIDEPQSVDNTAKSKEAIASLNPLVQLRYSATHKEKINLLYRLTPVDAYQMGLVKQICVSSNTIESDFNRPYIRLVSVSQDGGFKAKIEIDQVGKDGTVSRKTITIKPNTDLYEKSGERDLYKGYSVIGIDCTPGRECIEFSDSTTLALGKAIGDIDENIIKRAQIRRTIETHLEKELRYLDKGIKVLSLFFIDEVGKYRTAEGFKGIYAKMFEECYNELILLPKFADLQGEFPAVGSVHNGYFSQDKKGNYKNTKGDTEADYDTYNTIMKDKEWLLSFDCPLRFIFSHSALKEGWDNPNVFQVCTLIEQKPTFTARQKVGRGLRLCVNQNGERIEDRNINILHVMANESFAEFADNLQKEIENETGVKFGVLQLSMFSGITFTEEIEEEKQPDSETAEAIAIYVQSIIAKPIEAETEIPKATVTPPPTITPSLAIVVDKAVAAAKMGAEVTPEKVAAITYTETKTVEKSITYEEASELMTHFEKKGYISKSGAMKDTMKNALLNGTLDIPAKFEAARDKFINVISKANMKPPVHDASKEVRVKLKKEVIVSPEFEALWNKIKGKTSYRVAIDENSLKDQCVAALEKCDKVSTAQIVSKTAKYDVAASGVDFTETEIRAAKIASESHTLPDFIRTVDDELFLCRASAVDILRQSNRLRDFLSNPQKMTELFIETVKGVQKSMEIDGIRYHRLAGEDFYLQEIFDSEELIGYLDKNAVTVQNSVYDHVIYDSSTIERPFAVALDNDPDVKMFFKIPDKFKIETPIGTYNPDWAVYVDKDGTEKLYFVLETKGTRNLTELHSKERGKIHCGAEHFKALSGEVICPSKSVTAWGEVKTRI
jgi:type III restriction enzyme